MAEINEIQQAVNRIVAETLERRLGNLRSEVAQQVALELGSVLAEVVPTTSQHPPAEDLLQQAVAEICGTSSQSDVLGALLNGTTNFARRVALFVMRSGSAVLWQARGFTNATALKNFALNPAGLASRALQNGDAVTGRATDFDRDFVARVGTPHDGNAAILPLAVRDRVVALLYADGGQGADAYLNTPALSVLARSSGLWLELLTLRKGAVASGDISGEAAVSVPAQSFGARAGAMGIGSAPAAVRKSPPPAPARPATTAAPARALSPQDDELPQKARRFAKLLVDEIRLYNQTKVAAGRANRDLYDRLREDIDKSRATYDKRYGSTPVASADYFTQELVRILADNDPALLGINFPH
jgi:hypothetical protein